MNKTILLAIFATAILTTGAIYAVSSFSSGQNLKIVSHRGSHRESHKSTHETVSHETHPAAHESASHKKPETKPIHHSVDANKNKSHKTETDHKVSVSAAGSASGSYTYFAFEREWPGTVCKQNKCTSADMGNFDSKNFNLHGLWPSGLDGNVCGYPQDCASTHFSFNNINSSVKSYMNSYWVGLYSSTQSFLDHEWTKHGTCYGDNQNDYFTKATDLHKKYNAVSALAAARIYPSDTATYKVSEMQNALQSSFGGPVFMQCKFISGEQYFFAFDMYFNKSLTGIIDQPCKKNSSCDNNKPVRFPTVAK